MKPQQQKQQPEKEPKDVAVGDELYVHHGGQPHTCRVVAHGRHGVTGEIEGKHHKFTWDRVLGHKKRAKLRYRITDQGEDGMILEDHAGNRRYLATPNEAKEDPYVAKALDPRRPVLLLKAGEPKGPTRPGLTEKHLTDKRGVQTTRYVRTQKDQPRQRQRAAGDAEAGAAHGYGTHNLSAGDTVHFAAGDFQGSGVIVGEPGADGAHVKDASGRVHQVRWAEITGHEPREGQKPTVQHGVRGEQKPIPADQFKAGDYAAQHNDPNVTPEAILSQFPPDTAEKIQAVQERLKSVEETIEQHKQGDDYDEKRKALHVKIYDHFLSPEKVIAATPPEGQKPTLTLLGGRGGSGKSWFKGKVYDEAHAIVIDPDEIKGMLPEYEGWNAHQVHSESSDITDEIIKMARDFGCNVVLDATMKTAKSTLKKLDEFKGAGYRVEAHYMHLPRQEAAKRAVQRFLGKTQRYVPVDVVLGNTENEKTFDQVREHADRWSFRDNNVQQGQEPILISQGGKDHEEQPLKKSLGATILLVWKRP
jgi:predicted ABC-type ATPase